MGLETILIEGTPYNPLAISKFHLVDDMYDNLMHIRAYATRNPEPSDWHLQDFEASLSVDMLDGNTIGISETLPLPDNIVETFRLIQATPLPRFFGKHATIEKMRFEIADLLASKHLDDMMANLRMALAGKRDRLEREWQEQLKSIPLVRIELPGDTALVMMPPLKSMTYRY